MDFFLLVVLAALWGASFLFIRVASPILGPALLVDCRVLIAAFSLALYAIVVRQRVQLLVRWKSYMVLGAINAAVPFCLISIAELRLSAALAAILNATTPMFTAVVARIWMGETLPARKVCGLVLGIFGVLVAVGSDFSVHAASPVLWASCSLLAALAYAFGGVYSARKFVGISPLDLSIGQQLAAGIWLFPFIFFHRIQTPFSTSVVYSVLALAVLSTALGYLIYFRLMQRVGPVKTISVTFLVPVFGLVWGAAFLHERLSLRLLIALAVILCSVALVTNTRFRRRKPEAEAETPSPSA
ncbi:DMT family transporter [Alicyclobacillus fastidiosus]|uniref:DMT family transporter n=1 Tax=Alicyclobacillus fastidiosus TaxID=392011 RepID=A0ABV5AAP8_9BACL|nr:DMT family transporter [Alicyclobacillus fastidiosus]WEH12067.1 DMT family transporter [Alicyclobacillus fastidiosus]